MNQHSTLSNRVIVLAGGSGGLGSATAQRLAAEGARLVVSYRSNQERAQRLGDIASLVAADLRNAEDRKNLLDQAPELYGLVVFTGDPSRVKDPAELASAAGRSWETNFLGPMLLAREAAARIETSGTQGAIVLFSTMQAVNPFPGSTAYASAKAALQQAARVLAKEMRASNIRVNVIAPGVTAAGMAEASIASGKYNHFLESGIVPRFGRAVDIARTVRFLLEPDNYITGQILSVDGGATL